MGKPSKFSNLDYRLVVYLFAGAIILFYVLALTGCLSESPGIPNIFLVNIHKQGANNTQVRVGYFGVCINDRSKLYCLSSFGKDTKTVVNDLSKKGISKSSDISALLSIALAIQSKIFPCLLASAGVIFLFGVGALVLLKRSFKKPNLRKPLRPKLFRTATMLFGGAAIALAIASAVATTQTANALTFATSTPTIGNGSIRISPGIAVQVLQWLIVGFSIIFQVSLESMFKVQGNVNAVGTLPFPAPMGPPGISDDYPPIGPPGSHRFSGFPGGPPPPPPPAGQHGF